MWETISALIPLVFLIFKEVFSAQARARAADEKFVLDQTTVRKIVDAAVGKWVERNAQDSIGQGNAWDQADRDSASQNAAPDKKP